MRWITACTLMLLAAPVAAQVEPAEPTAKQDAESTESRFKSTHDESIYVVQRRTFSKSGKLEVAPMFFTAINPKFVGYAGPAIAAVYHFRENLAVEFLTSIYTYAFYSGLVHEVYEFENLTPEDVDLKQIVYFNAFSLQFSALYGKLELYGVLVDYDFYVTAGIGYARMRETCQPRSEDGTTGDPDCSTLANGGSAARIRRGFKTPARGSDANKVTGNLGGGLRLFFHDMLGIRVELRDIVFADRKVETSQTGQVGGTTTDIRNTWMLNLAFLVMLF